MKRKWLTILILFASVLIVSYLVGSCKKHDIVHFTTSLQQVIPDAFPQPVYRFEDNSLTKEGFELGKKLFYDGRLSRDTGFPCSSCHQQVAIFGTYEHDRSWEILRQIPFKGKPEWNVLPEKRKEKIKEVDERQISLF